jgi:hypothetical protein
MVCATSIAGDSLSTFATAAELHPAGRANSVAAEASRPLQSQPHHGGVDRLVSRRATIATPKRTIPSLYYVHPRMCEAFGMQSRDFAVEPGSGLVAHGCVCLSPSPFILGWVVAMTEGYAVGFEVEPVGAPPWA